MSEIGQLGEELVGKWLQTQNYLILHRRWRCRWGEIDLIVQEKDSLILAFVEVKTRNPRNWDNDGILAITSQKQGKLWQTAAAFLGKHPHLAELPCRFDVALVSYQIYNQKEDNTNSILNIKLDQPIFWRGYKFTLKNYFESAF